MMVRYRLPYETVVRELNSRQLGLVKYWERKRVPYETPPEWLLKLLGGTESPDQESPTAKDYERAPLK